VKRTLSTKSGLLLTGQEAAAKWKEIDEEREAERKEKEGKVVDVDVAS